MSEVLKEAYDCDFNDWRDVTDHNAGHIWRVNNLSFGANVRQAMIAQYGYAFSRIRLQENKEKYYNAHRPDDHDPDLQEVFSVMRSLNEQALASPTLGQTESNRQSFVGALEAIIDMIPIDPSKPSLQYVELGPEPVKTSFILRQLLKKGVQIASYTGVDINPASAPEMRVALEGLLRPDQITFRRMAFDEFQTDQIRLPNTQLLVTMLGFQEGNEDPETMSSWLGGIAGRGDFLLSEMQLSSKRDEDHIMAFYQNPLMKRFSKIAFERVFGTGTSEYRVYILPVTLGDGNIVETAVMCEAFEEDGREMLLVTNYCLKFSKEQFRYYREFKGDFKVLGDSYMGDQSVVFQLSQRR